MILVNQNKEPRYTWFVVEKVNKEAFVTAINFNRNVSFSVNQNANIIYELMEMKKPKRGDDVLSDISKTSRNLEHRGELSRKELNTILCSFFIYFNDSPPHDSHLIIEELFNVLKLVKIRHDQVGYQSRILDFKDTNRMIDKLVKNYGFKEIGYRFDETWKLVELISEPIIEEVRSQTVFVGVEIFNLERNELSVNDIMGEFLRGDLYRPDLFFNDESYDNIRDSIINSLITFVVGNPLSGKTRVVFDAIQRLKEGFLVKVIPHEGINEYILPRYRNVIVFFDDIDDHFRKNVAATNKLLWNLIRNKIKFIVTCRTGPEYDILQRATSRQIFEILKSKIFHIPRFKTRDPSVQSFIEKHRSEFNTDLRFFDGNFGSIILNLEEMRNRYLLLKSEHKVLSSAILVGLKLHYHYHNFEVNKSTYDEIKIKIFCEKFIAKQISQADWEEAKNEIESSDTSLNFIHQNDHIIIEEAYLDFLYNDRGLRCDVIDDYPEFKLKNLLRSLYTMPEERRNLGFPGSINDYNSLIYKSETYDEAIKIFEKIPIDLDKNRNTYVGLMKLSRDSRVLIHIYNLMKRQKFNMLYFPIGVFVCQFDSFKELLFALRKTERLILSSTNGVTKVLISLARKNPKENLELVFTEFSNDRIFKNPAFNELVHNLAEDEEDFERYFSPYLSKLKELDYGFRYNFIRTILKLGKYELGSELLDIHIKNENKYDYLNEKANILTRTSLEEALKIHFEALNIAYSNQKKMKSLTNICRIYGSSNDLIPHENFVTTVHAFLHDNFEIIKNLRSFIFLIEGLIILEMKNLHTPRECLEKISYLNQLDYISRGSFNRAKDKLNEAGAEAVTLFFNLKN